MIRVSRKQPCPVCGKSDWCGLSEDGAVAICMRLASPRPARNGGWVHVVGQTRPVFERPPRTPVVKPPLFNARSLIDRWTAETSLSALYDFADSLGVSASSLAALGACRAASHDAWAFPMRNGEGAIIGIRLRNDQGRKWAVPGSREGLFYPEADVEDPALVVCEGPTDTAAALSIGLHAVGRPSCLGAVDAFKAFARRRRVRRLIIIGDNDAPRKSPDGRWWQPGLEGAMKLARQVELPCQLVVPPVKDLREWVRAGLTADQFHHIAHQQREHAHGW